MSLTDLGNFPLYASHHQFIVQDSVLPVEGDYGVWNDPETLRRGLAVCSSHELAVGTRSYGEVSVQVQLSKGEPAPPTGEWQHVAEASLHVDSGKVLFLTVANAGTGDVPSVSLEPGVYRIRVLRKGLETVSDETEIGDERVLVLAWQSSERAPELLLEHPRSSP